jgi:hypothetical protein
VARRQRDYAAEYARRIELAQSRGQTKAQGRRGARKYAATPPREHVRRRQATQQRFGISPSQLQRVRRAQRAEPQGRYQYRALPFPSIEAAGRYARTELGPLQASFMAAYGTFRDTKVDSDYDRTKTTNRGWASVSELTLPNAYDQAMIDAIQDQADTIFTQVSRVSLKVKDFQ